MVQAPRATETEWQKTFETGALFSYILSSMSFDLFYLYQLNRFPALDIPLATAGTVLVPTLKNVSTFGFGASRGFSEIVVGANARYTIGHPVGTTLTYSHLPR